MNICPKCFQEIVSTVHICPYNDMRMRSSIPNFTQPSELDATLTRLKMMRETMMAKLAELQGNIDAIDKVVDIVAAGRESHRE